MDWKHVGERTLRVERATNPDGSFKPTKTTRTRSVRLAAALRDDFANAPEPHTGLIFARGDGEAMTETGWRNWHARRFRPAAQKAGAKIKRAYDLRHAAASLWLRAGIDPVQVAAWMGHSPSTLLTMYAHVHADLDPEDRRSVDELIAAARNGSK